MSLFNCKLELSNSTYSRGLRQISYIPSLNQSKVIKLSGSPFYAVSGK